MGNASQKGLPKRNFGEKESKGEKKAERAALRARFGEDPSSCWRTPRGPFYLLDAEFHFNLDGAAAFENALCSCYLARGGGGKTRERDGLALTCLGDAWGYEITGDERIFLNPPYGGPKSGERSLGAWMDLAISWCDRGALVVVWMPSDTETGWYAAGWQAAREVRALRGRVSHGRDPRLGDGVDRPRTGTSVFVLDPRKRASEGPGRWWVWDWKAEMAGKGEVAPRRHEEHEEGGGDEEGLRPLDERALGSRLRGNDGKDIR